jgi:hypothetical protein
MIFPKNHLLIGPVFTVPPWPPVTVRTRPAQSPPRSPALQPLLFFALSISGPSFLIWGHARACAAFVPAVLSAWNSLYWLVPPCNVWAPPLPPGGHSSDHLCGHGCRVIALGSKTRLCPSQHILLTGLALFVGWLVCLLPSKARVLQEERTCLPSTREPHDPGQGQAHSGSSDEWKVRGRGWDLSTRLFLPR